MYKIIRTYHIYKDNKNEFKKEIICTTYKLTDKTLLDLLCHDNVVTVEAFDTIKNKVVAIAVPSNDYVRHY